jgi:hypothetical protein
MDKTRKSSIEYAGLSSKFWIAEQPQVLCTRDNCFRFYPEAGVLSVSTPDYPDKVTGEPRIGKTVTVQLSALIESPATLKALLEILCAARDKVPRDTWVALK